MTTQPNASPHSPMRVALKWALCTCTTCLRAALHHLTMIDEPQTLRFVQLNINKSNTSQSVLLHSISDYDLVFLQEPHIDFLKNTCASQQWKVTPRSIKIPLLTDLSS